MCHIFFILNASKKVTAENMVLCLKVNASLSLSLSIYIYIYYIIQPAYEFKMGVHDQYRIKEDLLSFKFIFIFWPCHLACGISVSQPGLRLTPLIGKRVPNGWTTRGTPDLLFLAQCLERFPRYPCQSCHTPTSIPPTLVIGLSHWESGGRKEADINWTSTCASL